MISLNGIYMWTCFIVLISKIFFQTISNGHNGLIYVWAFGIPLLLLILYLTLDDTLIVLSKKINEFKKGEEVQKYIRYFLHLIKKRRKDRSIDIYIKGFVYTHEENCNISDCPLKKFKRILDRPNSKLESSNLNITSYQVQPQSNIAN